MPVGISRNGISASCNKKKKDTSRYHNHVDLGLSVLWSATNIGAEKETDYGDFFAWGENKVKDYYADCTYKYRIEDGEMFGHQFYRYTKYVTNDNSRDSLYDDKLELDDEDDAAIVLWKEKWRMPTEKEFKELLDKRNCLWEWYPPERIPKPSPPPVCGDLQSPHILVGSGVCNSHCRKATKHRIKNKRFSASHNLFFSGGNFKFPIFLSAKLQIRLNNVPSVASEQSSSGKFDLTERFCRICDSAELSTK